MTQHQHKLQANVKYGYFGCGAEKEAWFPSVSDDQSPLFQHCNLRGKSEFMGIVCNGKATAIDTKAKAMPEEVWSLMNAKHQIANELTSNDWNSREMVQPDNVVEGYTHYTLGNTFYDNNVLDGEKLLDIPDEFMIFPPTGYSQDVKDEASGVYLLGLLFDTLKHLKAKKVKRTGWLVMPNDQPGVNGSLIQTIGASTKGRIRALKMFCNDLVIVKKPIFDKIELVCNDDGTNDVVRCPMDFAQYESVWCMHLDSCRPWEIVDPGFTVFKHERGASSFSLLNRFDEDDLDDGHMLFFNASGLTCTADAKKFLCGAGTDQGTNTVIAANPVYESMETPVATASKYLGIWFWSPSHETFTDSSIVTCVDKIDFVDISRVPKNIFYF